MGPDIYESLLLVKCKLLKKQVFCVGDAIGSGSYVYEKIAKIKTILDQIIFSQNIYPFYAVIIQTDAKGLLRSFNEFSLSDPSSYEKLIFKDNPKLYFFSREEIFNLSAIDYNFDNLDENSKIIDQRFTARISKSN